MKKRTMRNIVFGIQVSAICGAAVFASAGIRQTVKSAEPDTTAMAVRATEVIEQSETVEPQTPHETPAIETEAISQEVIYSMDWDAEDLYLLAKIAMAEAEGEDTEGKALVMLVVLNRVWSENFPNSIEEVIFQKSADGTWQFSPMQEGGRWYTTEPDADCYKALELIQVDGWDESNGALYFESESASTWHKKNLKPLFQHGRHYFYTDKE